MNHSDNIEYTEIVGLYVKICSLTELIYNQPIYNYYTSHILTNQVIQNLHEVHRLSRDLYSAKNVLLSATHTHSGPAGYMQYALFQMPSIGFNNQTFNALVDGITKVSILVPFLIDLTTGISDKFPLYSHF